MRLSTFSRVLLSLILLLRTTTSLSAEEELASELLLFERGEADRRNDEKDRKLFLLLCKARPDAWVKEIETVIDGTDDEDTLALATSAIDIIEESKEIDIGDLRNVDGAGREFLVERISELDLDGILSSLKEVRRDLDAVMDMTGEDRLVGFASSLRAIERIIELLREVWELAMMLSAEIDLPGGEVTDFILSLLVVVSFVEWSVAVLLASPFFGVPIIGLPASLVVFSVVFIPIWTPTVLLLGTVGVLTIALFYVLEMLNSGEALATRRLECTWTRLLARIPRVVVSMDRFQKSMAEAEP